MQIPTREEFTARALAAGFDEVVERQWPPLAVVPLHTHPFAVEAIVVHGEMWLDIGEASRHLRVGDRFALARDIPHAERYGSAGATYWVARRN